MSRPHRHLTLIGCAVLGVVAAAAALLGGVPTFPQPRWLPGAIHGPVPPQSTAQPTLGGHNSSSTSASPLWPLIVFGVVAIGAAIAVWLILRVLLRAIARRRSRPAQDTAVEELPPLNALPDDEIEPDAPVLHRGLRLALEALDEDREPADAVVRAWLGLQAAAEDSGVQRRAAETPTEFTARVITRVKADSGAAQQLVDVYQLVRFGGHPITSADVHAARGAVERLLDSWHEPVLGLRR